MVCSQEFGVITMFFAPTHNYTSLSTVVTLSLEFCIASKRKNLSVAPILNMTFTSMSNANSLDSAARAEAAASDKKRGRGGGGSCCVV